MIRLQATPIDSVEDARERLQIAINLELATLPVYLYAKFSILPDTNAQATADLSAIVGEEMTHMCLACNIINAIGGTPLLQPLRYPSTMPGDIGRPGEPPLKVSLLHFSKPAMEQGMAIEQPVKPIPVPPPEAQLEGSEPETETIGQFYEKLDAFLATLEPGAWTPNRNQIDDSQFLSGQIYAVRDYDTAHLAISQIVSEGEGTPDVPLDFEDELAHYYRFWALAVKRELSKSSEPPGYKWGAPLDVDFEAAFPAIDDPAHHDFSNEPPAAQAAQEACNGAYSRLIDALQLAVSGQPDQLGAAVRAMFDLRKAALIALRTPLSSGKVAGPAFLYQPTPAGAAK